MRRRLTCTLGALALGWLAGPALAADPGSDPAAALTAPMPNQNAAGPVLAPGETSGAPAEAGGGRLFAGAGAYVLKPFLEKERAWVKMISVAGANGDFQNVQVTDFTYDLQAAPRVWLGWVSDAGWGARARYFHLDADGNAPAGSLSADETHNTGPLGPSDMAHAFVLNPAEPLGQTALNEPTANLFNGVGTDVLTVSSGLRMDVWDLEATDQLTSGCWQWTFAAGVRHADLAEFYDATRRNTLDPGGNDVRTLRSSHRFTGTGPELAVDGCRRFGDTGLAVYGTIRGAGLFGTRRQLAFARSTSVFDNAAFGGGGIFGPDLGTTSFEKHDFVPEAEGEFGMEWSRDLSALRPFLQVGVVGQGWFNALTNNNPGTGIPPTVVNGGGLLGLLGVTITAGVSY